MRSNYTIEEPNRAQIIGRQTWEFIFKGGIRVDDCKIEQITGLGLGKWFLLRDGDCDPVNVQFNTQQEAIDYCVAKIKFNYIINRK